MIPLALLAFIGIELHAPFWFWALYTIEAVAVAHKISRDWKRRKDL